jgi:formylmethanofuran dehydrogenase subunit C
VNLQKKVMNADLFDDLGREERVEELRKIDVKTNPSLEWLLKCFDEFRKDNSTMLSKYYDNALNLLKGQFKINSLDIELFSIYNHNNKSYSINGDFLGIFLTAATNLCLDDTININTNHMEILPNYLGYQNKSKRIIVSGNVGSSLGLNMNSGEIIVNGNTNYGIGCDMSGGVIRIKGNVGYVKTAGEYGEIGFRMKKGEIYFEGDDLPKISDNIDGGDIYHKGKLIVKDGKVLK